MFKDIENQIFTLIFLCSLWTIAGCQKPESKTEKQDKNYSLQVSNSLTFALDSSKTAYSRGVRMYSQKNRQYLLFFHFNEKQISIYDLGTQKLVSDIQFDFEGPNAVPRSINYAYTHNFDSIFLFDPLPQKMYLLDSAGNKKDEYNIQLEDLHYVYADGIHPPQLHQGIFYLPTYPAPMENATSSDYGMIEFKIKNKNFGAKYNLSRKYDEGFWDKHSYRQAVSVYNTVTDKIVMSFPNDEYIYVTDAQGNKSKHFAGSSEMKTLKPLAEEQYYDDERTFRMQAEQGFYSGLKYDRWRKVYYRFAYNPINKFADRSTLGQNASIIILNDKFEIIGESPVNAKTYSFGINFINEEGLYLFNNHKYEKVSDSQFTFDLFKLKKTAP